MRNSIIALSLIVLALTACNYKGGSSSTSIGRQMEQQKTATVDAYAQNDTTLFDKPVKFECETIPTKSGEQTVKYYAIVDGKYYDSNETSAKRYHDAKRLGDKPNVSFVSNKKNTIVIVF